MLRCVAEVHVYVVASAMAVLDIVMAIVEAMGKVVLPARYTDIYSTFCTIHHAGELIARSLHLHVSASACTQFTSDQQI